MKVYPKKVAVLMPVYNGEAFIAEAIDSILAQTFTDFNFYIINDGSTDDTVKIVESYKDERIRLFSLDENSGISTALNEGIKLIEEPYIARMDADDIAVPDRLKLQVSFMDENTNICVSGGNLKIIAKEEIWRYPIAHEDIVSAMLFNNAMAHNAVIMRTNFVKSLNQAYRSEYKGMEDYDLWFRMASKGNLANIDKVLMHYRRSAKSVTIADKSGFRPSAMTFFEDKFKTLGIAFTGEELAAHVDIHLKNEEEITFGSKHLDWLEKFEKEIISIKIYPSNALKSIIRKKKNEVLKLIKL